MSDKSVSQPSPPAGTQELAKNTVAVTNWAEEKLCETVVDIDKWAFLVPSLFSFLLLAHFPFFCFIFNTSLSFVLLSSFPFASSLLCISVAPAFLPCGNDVIVLLEPVVKEVVIEKDESEPKLIPRRFVSTVWATVCCLLSFRISAFHHPFFVLFAVQSTHLGVSLYFSSCSEGQAAQDYVRLCSFLDGSPVAGANITLTPVIHNSNSGTFSLQAPIQRVTDEKGVCQIPSFAPRAASLSSSESLQVIVHGKTATDSTSMVVSCQRGSSNQTRSLTLLSSTLAVITALVLLFPVLPFVPFAAALLFICLVIASCTSQVKQQSSKELCEIFACMK